jgi:hypothetical protein
MSVYRVVAHFYGYAWSCIQGIAWDLTSIHPSIMQRQNFWGNIFIAIYNFRSFVTCAAAAEVVLEIFSGFGAGFCRQKSILVRVPPKFQHLISGRLWIE